MLYTRGARSERLSAGSGESIDISYSQKRIVTYAMLYTRANKRFVTLVSCLHATSQPFLPKTTNAIILAPLLYHPGLELVFDDFPLIDLRRCIFLLATPCLGLGLQPLDLESQALLVQPGCEIFKYDRIIQ